MEYRTTKNLFLSFTVITAVACAPSDNDSYLASGFGDEGDDAPTLYTRSNGPECVDSDGDGYGWNGFETCDPNEAQGKTSECIDADGDGYGWNGFETCTPIAGNTGTDDTFGEDSQTDGGEILPPGGTRESLIEKLVDQPSGKIMAGQESTIWDLPWEKDFPTDRDLYVHDTTDKLPALFATDFGDFDLDDLAGGVADMQYGRQRIVDLAERYHDEGSTVMLSYHMCQPDVEDGCGFDVMHGFSRTNPYPSWKIDEILTPGTSLNQIHLQRIDDLAGYLGQLQQRGVPVLWRPFHEMNGDWFWWGQKERYVELYRQMYDRLTYHHGLDNLVWVWSVNHWTNTGEPTEYYPGHDVVDVLGVDVYEAYGHGYGDEIYNRLKQIGGGKPIGITENGNMPNWNDIRDTQPDWKFWCTWHAFERPPYNSTNDYAQYDSANVITLNADVD